MHDHLNIDTPENIALDAQIGGFASRVYAALIDHLILFLALFGLLIVVAPISDAWTEDTTVLALVLTAMFALFMGYHLGFELVWNGQTPGKRVMGLRVVQTDGLPVTVAAVITRNLVRVFDFFPLAYGVGLLALFFSEHTQRLGDMAAKTVVIRERRAVKLSEIREDYTVQYTHITRYDRLPEDAILDHLDETHRGLITRYLRRRGEMQDRLNVALQLARQLWERSHGDPFMPYTQLAEVERYLEGLARAFEVRDSMAQRGE